MTTTAGGDTCGLELYCDAEDVAECGLPTATVDPSGVEGPRLAALVAGLALRPPLLDGGEYPTAGLPGMVSRGSDAVEHDAKERVTPARLPRSLSLLSR